MSNCPIKAHVEGIMILLKTEAGQQVFRDRSVRLTPRQRSAFILFDGKRSVGEILSACAGVAAEDIDQMIAMGLLEPPLGTPTAPMPSLRMDSPSGVSAVDAPGASETAMRAPDPGVSPQQRYKDAYPIATQLTGALGLNLAVEGTASYDELLALAPKIRSAVGPEKAATLDRALGL
jgi:hypothetical protein